MARIALEASASNETLSEIARRHSVHPIQVGKWRKELIERAHELFTDGRRRGAEEQSEAVEALYEQIGRLKVENDFLKKIWSWELMISAQRLSRVIGSFQSLRSANCLACRALVTIMSPYLR